MSGNIHFPHNMLFFLSAIWHSFYYDIHTFCPYNIGYFAFPILYSLQIT